MNKSSVVTASVSSHSSARNSGRGSRPSIEVPETHSSRQRAAYIREIQVDAYQTFHSGGEDRSTWNTPPRSRYTNKDTLDTW